MAQETAEAWEELIEEKYNEFAARQCRVPDNIDHERSFREAFEVLCKSQLIFNYTRLLAKLSYSHISAFAKAVDGAFGHSRPYTLAILVFGGCFVAIKNAYESQLPLTELVELLGLLNKSVPSLAIDVPRFPADIDVQVPLQHISNLYIDTLLIILDSLNTTPNAPAPKKTALHELNSKVHQVAMAFEVERQKFIVALERAQRHDNNRVSNSSWSHTSARSDSSQGSRNAAQARFETIRRLGSGSFGEVYEVRELSFNRVSARKIFNLNRWNSDPGTLEQQVKKEYQIMESLVHAHIVKVLLPLKEGDTFSIFMQPVADCHLGEYLQNCIETRFPTEKCQRIFSWFGCLLRALEFAHRRDIVHRDIKPSNILVKDGLIYLADFGLAKDFTNHSMTMSDGQVRGTPLYRAPEVRPDHERGPPADVFSLGCVFSEMLTVTCGKSLSEYKHYRENREDEVPAAFRANLPKVSSWLHELGKDKDDDLRNPLLNLTRTMLRKDPNLRPTCQSARKTLQSTEQEEFLFCPGCI